MPGTHAYPWTPALEQKLIQMREGDHLTYAQIASRFGFTAQGIERHYKKLRPEAHGKAGGPRGSWTLKKALRGKHLADRSAWERGTNSCPT